MITKILSKFKTPKKRTNRPMIERSSFDIINQGEGGNKFSARQRIRRMGLENSLEGQLRQMTRYWNKASPKKKALIVAASVGPKAVLVGAGYYLSAKDKKEKKI